MHQLGNWLMSMVKEDPIKLESHTVDPHPCPDLDRIRIRTRSALAEVCALRVLLF